jgi:hypothetical protein
MTPEGIDLAAPGFVAQGIDLAAERGNMAVHIKGCFECSLFVP